MMGVIPVPVYATSAARAVSMAWLERTGSTTAFIGCAVRPLILFPAVLGSAPLLPPGALLLLLLLSFLALLVSSNLDPAGSAGALFPPCLLSLTAGELAAASIGLCFSGNSSRSPAGG